MLWERNAEAIFGKRIPERDYVAGFDGFIEQDNHTRHKVRHHLLQTKAKADTNRT